MARKRKKNSKRWIQKAIKKPNRVRNYLKRVYGSAAFTKDGKIKMSYIDKALKRLKKVGVSENRSLYSALVLAKRLKSRR